MSRDVISDEMWAVIGPLFPKAAATGRPPTDPRQVVEATAWRYRTGAPWRDLPEQFGTWNTVYKIFDRWAKAGVWAKVLDRLHDRAGTPARRHAALCLAATLHWLNTGSSKWSSVQG